MHLIVHAHGRVFACFCVDVFASKCARTQRNFISTDPQLFAHSARFYSNIAAGGGVAAAVVVMMVSANLRVDAVDVSR